MSDPEAASSPPDVTPMIAPGVYGLMNLEGRMTIFKISEPDEEGWTVLSVLWGDGDAKKLYWDQTAHLSPDGWARWFDIIEPGPDYEEDLLALRFLIDAGADEASEALLEVGEDPDHTPYWLKLEDTVRAIYLPGSRLS